MSGRLEVKIDGNASGFKHAMDTVRTQAKGAADEIGHSWSGGLLSSISGGIAAAFTFDAVKSSLESFLGRAKEIKDLSEQFDLSTDSVQKWGKAAEAAGLSASNAFNVLSAIQSKRQEALRDPKAADLFAGLGISRDEVLHEDNSEFAKKVLLAGGKSDENRSTLEQIVGRRGLKMIAASKGVDQATPDLNTDSIKAADEAEKAERKVGSVVNRQWAGAISNLANAIDFVKGDLSYADWAKRGVYVLGKKFKADAANTASTAPKQGGEINLKASDQPGYDASGEHQPGEDPLKAVKNQQQMEYDLQREEAEMGLHSAERHNMTIAGRKASIKADLAVIDKEVSEREKAHKEGTIYGMTKEQQSKLLPTDSEKQLREDYIKLLGAKGKQAGLTGELRQGTNFNMSADSLARVGLFSSSTLSINPMVQLSQHQIKVLEKIEHNTSKQPENPHRR